MEARQHHFAANRSLHNVSIRAGDAAKQALHKRGNGPNHKNAPNPRKRKKLAKEKAKAKKEEAESTVVDAEQLVGATTTDEFRQTEQDEALARSLQFEQTVEPSVQDCISAMSGIKTRYGPHHNGVRITDAALVAAVVYAHRYPSHGSLQDAAIELVREAASAKRRQQAGKPEAIEDLDGAIMTMGSR
ncbi:MAG: hypothetical protein L6R38_007198 [Xanthoria sp. 2 TBL-2021]|nr:MAG: hypothetical protein L6R38_007198 [Xanthoria sp. 2 TBL-2021]